MSAAKKVAEMSTEARLSASLKQVKKDAAPPAPSIVPDGLLPPPPKEEEHVPTLNEVFHDRAARLKLARALEEERKYAAIESEAKKLRKPHSDYIKKTMGEAQVGKFLWNDMPVSYFGSERETVSKEKLITALATMGMQPNQIKGVLLACVTSKPVYTLRIGKGKDKEDE